METMEIEQLEIRDFIAQCPPLDKVGKECLDEIVNNLEINYARRGETILKTGDSNEWVHLIRTGAVEVFDPEGNLVCHYGAGDWFGYSSVLRGGEVVMQVNAIEDCLFYMIPAALFLKFFSAHNSVKKFFSDKKPERLRSAIQEIHENKKTTLVETHAGDLVTPNKTHTLDSQASIHDAAKLMTEKRLTSLLITDNGKLRGIITERAFCTELAAKKLDFDMVVENIMTPDPVVIPPETTGSEALLIMSRRSIRHLPVMRGNELLGTLTATDLIRHQSHTPIFLIEEILRAESVDELKQLSEQLPATLLTLVRSSMTAYDIGHIISSVGESITRRLLQFAEQRFGTPPVSYAWIAAGSLARNEQTAHSDQDNALIISDDFVPEQHDEYFLNLTRYVSDGLNTCGYIYCPGDVMATNQEWRQPLKVWRRYFDRWIYTPEEKALMYASIFFDLRCLHGEAQLLADLREDMLKKTRGNTIFLAHMSANALQFHPPLGLFRMFVLEKGGAEEKALNMKKRGVVPITDLARVYALSAGIDVLNTRDRLEAAGAAGEISHGGMEDLLDAYEFISLVRLEHQAAQIERGEKTNNFVPPEELSTLERRHLKDAFDVVQLQQTSLRSRYNIGR